MLCQIKLVSTHYTFFILKNWYSLKFESEWHSIKTSIISEPLPDAVVLLVEDNELIVSTRQNYVQRQLIFANLFSFCTRMIIETSERIVIEFFAGACINSSDHSFELGR
jgi:hypothetical protein